MEVGLENSCRLEELTSDHDKNTRKLKFGPDVPNTMRNCQKELPTHSSWETLKIQNGGFKPKYSIPILKDISLSVERSKDNQFCRQIFFILMRLRSNLSEWLLPRKRLLTCSKYWLEVNDVTKNWKIEKLL